MAGKRELDWLLFLALALLIVGVSPGYHLLAGHWVLLVGYAALPFAVKSFMELFEAPERKNAFF